MNRPRGLSFRRERDPYTRAVSLVVTRGFGVTVKLTGWWVSAMYHRRDAEMERLFTEAAAALDEQAQERESDDGQRSDT